jgi:hypothetical protein
MSILAAIFYLASTGIPICGQVGDRNAHIQWSEASIATAPNHSAQVEVHPVPNSDENASPVLLRSCADGRAHQLFTLERSADIYWDPASVDLLLINQRNADKYNISLFVANQKNGDMVEKSLDEVVMRRLPKADGLDRNVVFYLPRFVSWIGTELVVSVGGATVAPGGGPMSSYCYGVMIDTQSLQASVIPGDELKRGYGAQCQLAP